MGEPDVQNAETNRWRWLSIAIVLILLLLAIATFSLRRVLNPTVEEPVRIADVSSERLLGLGSVVGFAAPHERNQTICLPEMERSVKGYYSQTELFVCTGITLSGEQDDGAGLVNRRRR